MLKKVFLLCSEDCLLFYYISNQSLQNVHIFNLLVGLPLSYYSLILSWCLNINFFSLLTTFFLLFCVVSVALNFSLFIVMYLILNYFLKIFMQFWNSSSDSLDHYVLQNLRFNIILFRVSLLISVLTFVGRHYFATVSGVIGIVRSHI